MRADPLLDDSAAGKRFRPVCDAHFEACEGRIFRQGRMERFFGGVGGFRNHIERQE